MSSRRSALLVTDCHYLEDRIGLLREMLDDLEDLAFQLFVFITIRQ